MQNIVLLHGALGLESDLKGLSEALAAKGLNVHHFSFSGHGLKPFEENFGIEQFAAELEDFLNKNKIEQPDIFGYSMGGYVALTYALAKGDKVNRIITLGTKFNWSVETVKKETGLLVPEIIEQKAPAFAATLIAKHENAWKELVIRTAAMMHEISDRQFLNQTTLASVKNKVLLGLADKDNMVSYEETLNVYRTLPNAQMYVLPGTKHPFETVNTALLTTIIANFVSAT